MPDEEESPAFSTHGYGMDRVVKGSQRVVAVLRDLAAGTATWTKAINTGVDQANAKLDLLAQKIKAATSALKDIPSDIGGPSIGSYVYSSNTSSPSYIARIPGPNRTPPIPSVSAIPIVPSGSASISTTGIGYGTSFYNPSSTGTNTGGIGGSYIVPPSPPSAPGAPSSAPGSGGINAGLANILGFGAKILLGGATLGKALTANQDQLNDLNANRYRLSAFSQGGLAQTNSFFTNSQNLFGFNSAQNAQATAFGLSSMTGQLVGSPQFNQMFQGAGVLSGLDSGDPSRTLGATSGIYNPSSIGMNMMKLRTFLGYDPFQGGARPGVDVLYKDVIQRLNQANGHVLTKEELSQVLAPGTRTYASLAQTAGPEFVSQLRDYALAQSASGGEGGKALVQATIGTGATATLGLQAQQGATLTETGKIAETTIKTEAQLKTDLSAAEEKLIKDNEALSSAMYGTTRALSKFTGILSALVGFGIGSKILGALGGGGGSGGVAALGTSVGGTSLGEAVPAVVGASAAPSIASAGIPLAGPAALSTAAGVSSYLGTQMLEKGIKQGNTNQGNKNLIKGGALFGTTPFIGPLGSVISTLGGIREIKNSQDTKSGVIVGGVGAGFQGDEYLVELNKFIKTGPPNIKISDASTLEDKYTTPIKSFDLTGPSKKDQKQLLDIDNFWAKNSSYLSELIYTGPGGVSVVDGKQIDPMKYFSSKAISAHQDSVHVAISPENFAALQSGGPPTNSYAKGAWEIAKDEIASLHRGEMVVPAKQASDIRFTAATQSDKPSYKHTHKIEVTMTGASQAEADRLWKIIKQKAEDDAMLVELGKN